ncbi:hypothetical protein Cgig2_025817 [Carnegiea gigantea]|uniref:NB-ARC domain-containing protein n=1 Tax=Carnegiea gigantea TaxID=171969 RepID=A0A9Q1GYF3_9CARY|nr:hypothetical protein Cgig2_025817 [Carnegiea gigantea]
MFPGTVNQTQALILETGSHRISEEIIGRGQDGDSIITGLLIPHPSRVRKHFDQQLWVYATRDFKVKEMLVKIERKKCLLVLDKVRDEDSPLRLKWEELRILLVCARPGSEVLITIWDERVATTMGSIDPYKHGDLRRRDSWLLFQWATVTHRQDLELETGCEIMNSAPKFIGLSTQ